MHRKRHRVSRSEWVRRAQRDAHRARAVAATARIRGGIAKQYEKPSAHARARSAHSARVPRRCARRTRGDSDGAYDAPSCGARAGANVRTRARRRCRRRTESRTRPPVRRLRARPRCRRPSRTGGANAAIARSPCRPGRPEARPRSSAPARGRRPRRPARGTSRRPIDRPGLVVTLAPRPAAPPPSPPSSAVPPGPNATKSRPSPATTGVGPPPQPHPQRHSEPGQRSRPRQNKRRAFEQGGGRGRSDLIHRLLWEQGDRRHHAR